jgi:hypothetical protein
VITGFNTDIEYGGVTYHVQTEDKGLASPIILSLVYQGGAILASKRTPYHDLIAAGFDEAALTARLQRQHKLICAAIHAGRIEDLRQMGSSETATRPARGGENSQPAAEIVAASQTNGEVQTKDERRETIQNAIAQNHPQPNASGYSVRILKEGVADFVRTEAADVLHLALINETEFWAGKEVDLQIRLSRRVGANEPVGDTEVIIKILGTSFRSFILTARTDREGVAHISIPLPQFTRGRAALLVSAVVDGYEAELRRIIHAAQSEERKFAN